MTINKMKNDALWNHVKVKYKILLFHNFLVNALRAGLICPSLESPASMANLPFPSFQTFLSPSLWKIFCPYEIKDKHKNNFMREPYFFMLRRLPKNMTRIFVISIYINNNQAQISEAVVQRCSVKKVFLKTSQN